jgi:hypothetical protein
VLLFQHPCSRLLVRRFVFDSVVNPLRIEHIRLIHNFLFLIFLVDICKFHLLSNQPVNAGLLWVAAAFVKKNTENEYDGELEYEEDEYLHSVYREAGGISFLLTVANVILIIASSMLVMRAKERLPIKKPVFWEVSLIPPIRKIRRWVSVNSVFLQSILLLFFGIPCLFRCIMNRTLALQERYT